MRIIDARDIILIMNPKEDTVTPIHRSWVGYPERNIDIRIGMEHVYMGLN